MQFPLLSTPSYLLDADEEATCPECDRRLSPEPPYVCLCGWSAEDQEPDYSLTTDGCWEAGQ